MTPQASIIIPAYNAESSIAETIQSVLRQTEASLEIIVIDDGSSDATAAVVTKLAEAEPRLSLAQLPRNRGPAAARNEGIGLANGTWVGFVDAGDWISPLRVSELIAAGERERVEVVYDNQFFTRGAAEGAWRTLFTPPETAFQRLTAGDLIRNDTIGRVGNFGLLKPLVRRDFLTQHQLRFPERLRLGEDFCFHMRCYAAGARAILISKPSYHYHYHASGTSLSATHDLAALEAMIAEYRAIEQTFQAHGEAEVVGLLERKIAETEVFIAYKRVLESLRSLRPLEAVGRLVNQPAVAAVLLRRVISLCRTKVKMHFGPRLEG